MQICRVLDVRLKRIIIVVDGGGADSAGGARRPEQGQLRGRGRAGGDASGGGRRPRRDGPRGPHSAQPQRPAPGRLGRPHSPPAQQRRQRLALRRRRGSRPLTLHVVGARPYPAAPLRELRSHPPDAGHRHGRAPRPDEGPRPQGHVQVSRQQGYCNSFGLVASGGFLCSVDIFKRMVFEIRKKNRNWFLIKNCYQVVIVP